MEILYFIVGLLTAVVGYSTWQTQRLKNQNIRLNLDLEEIEYEFNKFTHGVSDDIDDLYSKISSVNQKLKEDSYNNIAEINKQLSELNKMSNAMNIRFGEANKLAEKQLSGAFSEIQQIKNNIKALNQDPNILNR